MNKFSLCLLEFMLEPFELPLEGLLLKLSRGFIFVIIRVWAIVVPVFTTVAMSARSSSGFHGSFTFGYYVISWWWLWFVRTVKVSSPRSLFNKQLFVNKVYFSLRF